MQHKSSPTTRWIVRSCFIVGFVVAAANLLTVAKPDWIGTTLYAGGLAFFWWYTERQSGRAA